MRAGEVSGVGLGWRREFAHDLLSRPEAVSFVEVVAETCFVNARLRAEALALAERWPVIPHGVKLSLGSADGIEPDHARRLCELAKALRSPWITEHASFTRAGPCDIGHLTQLPRTRAAVRALTRNVAVLRRYAGDIPVALENVAWTARWPDDEMDEATFYQEVTRATGCPLLLDLGNLYANAVNEGKDPFAVLDAYPLERVAMAHIAGGQWHASGERRFYIDSHAHPVPAEVFALLERLSMRRDGVPVILERDANFPSFGELVGELERARSAAGAPSAFRPPASLFEGAPAPLRDDALESRQARLASLLTRVGEPASAEPFDADEIRFARDVLRRKRIDDALPLLPRVSARVGSHRPAEWMAVADSPRVPRFVALNDAWRMAEASMRLPELRSTATLDSLVLTARTAAAGGVRVPRWQPWLGSRDLGDGRRAWVYKGFGVSATVRVLVR